MAETFPIILPWQPSIQATWTVAEVRTALDDHESGTFASSAQLWRAMGRDDRLSATLQTRIDGVLGAPCHLEAQDESSERDVEIAGELDADWSTIAPREQLDQFLGWYLGIGVAYGRLIEQREASRWRYCLDVWDPQHLRYQDWDQSWTVTTRDGEKTIEPGKDGWVLWCRGPRGWNSGMVRSLAVPWLVRAYAWRDWARWSERHGMPIVKAMVPAVAPAPDKQAFWDDIRAMSTETVVSLPQGVAEGVNYDLQLLEATALGWEGFERLLTACNVSYAVRVLGQNLTTEVQGGSFAAAQVSDDVRSDIKRSDAEGLYAIAREQILPPTVAANYGDGVAVPGPCYEVEPASDTKAVGDGLAAIGAGLAALKNAGVPVDAEAVATEAGVPLLAEEDRPEPVAPQPPRPEPPVADEPEDDEDEDGEELTAATGDTLALADAPGFVSGQLYTDKLVAGAVPKSVRAFRPDLEAVKAVIANSGSFETARRQLLSLYRDMAPDGQMRLLEKAFVLGQLAGAWSVQEDL